MAQFWAVITFFNNLWAAFKMAVGLAEKGQAAQMKKENREAIQEAVDGDQRKLERDVFHSPTAGKPSGLPGTELRDDIPDRLSDSSGN